MHATPGQRRGATYIPNPALVTAYESPRPFHIGASSSEARFEDTNTSFVSNPGVRVERGFCALIRRSGRKARATISGATVFVVSSFWKVAMSLPRSDETEESRAGVLSYVHVLKCDKGGY